jgi:hypothetical protein
VVADPPIDVLGALPELALTYGEVRIQLTAAKRAVGQDAASGARPG